MKVGVIGVGSMGKNHARIFSEIENAELVAIFDTNEGAAREMAEKFGGEAVSDMARFIGLVEAATVATPTPTHHPLGMELLHNGKHVLIEKPLTENPKEAKELVELSQQKKLVLQVGHVERFNPVLSALERHLTRPRFIEAHRLSPYPNRSTDIGVVLDLMIHDLEIILHLVKSKVKSLDAVGVAVLSKGEDIANARLRFENGCVANITVSRISPERMRKIRVFQEDAYLSLDYGNQTGEMHRKADGAIVREEVEIEKGEPLKRQLHDFVECARLGARPKVSGFEATAALELAIEITAEIERGLRENP